MDHGFKYEGKVYYTLSGVKSKISNDKFEEVIKSGRYILFEVYDHITESWGGIGEISIFDKNGKKIQYTVLEDEVFDSTYNGKPYHWTYPTGQWAYGNLYNNAIDYRTESEGSYSYTLFFGRAANMGDFARFIIDLGTEQDISTISVCVGDNVYHRTPKAISAYFIDNYSSKTYERNVKQRNNDGLTLIKTIEFEEIVTCPTWYNIMGQEKYLLVEVYDHIGLDSSVINEIEILNKYGEKLLYNVNVYEAYDSQQNGVPYYWIGDNNNWSYANLYDNLTDYSGPNSCIFTYYSGINTNKFARFILKVQNSDIGDIRINIGNYDSRMPKEVSVFSIDNYSDKTYENNVKVRNNGGLTLIKTMTFDTVITTPTWYSFMGQERYLLVEVYDHIGGERCSIK